MPTSQITTAYTSQPAERTEPTFGAMEAAELRAALAAVGFAADGPAQRAASTTGDAGERVPAAQVIALLDAAARALDDPLIGLHAALAVKPRGALVHLIMSAASLRDALGYIGRFSRLLIDALAIELHTGPRESALVFAFDSPSLAGHAQLIDYSLLATSRVLRGSVGAAFQLRGVRLRHAAPAGGAAAYGEAFDCPVRFDQTYDALLFASEALDVAPAVANPLVARQMEQLAQALAARGRAGASWAGRVGAVLRAELAEGRLRDRASIARELAMSEATLNRRLADEGTSFRGVRETAVWELADALLANPALKIESVALAVGFNDAAAFARALKRRAGCSPSAYRMRLLEAMQQSDDRR